MNLQGIEIFAVGEWRGNRKIKVTSETLDQMMASYDALGQTPGFRPPLVLGHGRTPGEPAYGWMDRMYRSGNKIVADFSDVPEYLVYSMKTKRYNSVSIEMYPTLDYNGKTFQNVLSAVAVLGAELPAVKGLKPLSESIPAEFAASVQGERVTLSKEDDAMFTQEQLDSLIAAAVKAAEAKFAADHAKEIEARDAKITAAEATIKTANEGRERAEAALGVFKRESEDRELNAFADQAIKDGKILPKQKDGLVAMAKSMSGVVKFGDNEVSALEAFKQFISDGPAKVDLSEKGGAAATDNKSASLEVDRRAKAEMAKDDKLTYAVAVEKVLAADNTLKLQYFHQA